MSQTCSGLTAAAGYTGTSPFHSSSAAKIYVNEAPPHRTQCNGTAYAWHYCYYDSQQSEDLEVAFGAYEAVFEGSSLDHYEIRPGSYYLLHLEDREERFTCDYVNLEETQYFQIHSGDRLGACLRNHGNTEFLDILAESASSSFSVGRWGGSSGQCRERDMSQSSGEETISEMVLHLYVDISKCHDEWHYAHILMCSSTTKKLMHFAIYFHCKDTDECALGLDNCHGTLATCIDDVGAEDSFTCTCISGYTGNGVTCTSTSECH